MIASGLLVEEGVRGVATTWGWPQPPGNSPPYPYPFPYPYPYPNPTPTLSRLVGARVQADQRPVARPLDVEEGAMALVKVLDVVRCTWRRNKRVRAGG